MISLQTIRTLANRYLENAEFDKDKAIKMCMQIQDERIRVQVINRIKGVNNG